MKADYLNKTVWATIKASSIEGLGVFAIRDIPKNTTITEVTYFDSESEFPAFISMDESEFDKIRPEIQKLILDKNIFPRDRELLFLSPNAVQDLRSFMNHSKEPNVINGVTLREVKKGEELTTDYKKVCPFEWKELSKKHFSYV